MGSIRSIMPSSSAVVPIWGTSSKTPSNVQFPFSFSLTNISSYSVTTAASTRPTLTNPRTRSSKTCRIPPPVSGRTSPHCLKDTSFVVNGAPHWRRTVSSRVRGARIVAEGSLRLLSWLCSSEFHLVILRVLSILIYSAELISLVDGCSGRSIRRVGLIPVGRWRMPGQRTVRLLPSSSFASFKLDH
jgi:hypothetical protein